MAITIEEVLNTINTILAQKHELEQRIVVLESELLSLKKSVKLKAVDKKEEDGYK